MRNYFFSYLWNKKLEFSTSKAALIQGDFSENHIFLFFPQRKQPCLFMSSHSLFRCFSNNLWLSAPKTTIRYNRTPTYIHRITEMFQPERTPPSPRKQSRLLTELLSKTFPPTFQWRFIIQSSFRGHRCSFSTRLKAKVGLTVTLWSDRMVHMLLPSRSFQQQSALEP